MMERSGQELAILRCLHDGLIIINKKADILEFTPSAERMFGYSSLEVTGQNINMLMPEDVARHHDDYVDRHEKGISNKIIGEHRVTDQLTPPCKLTFQGSSASI